MHEGVYYEYDWRCYIDGVVGIDDDVDKECDGEVLDEIRVDNCDCCYGEYCC